MTYVQTYSHNLTIFHTQSHADKHLPVTPAGDKSTPMNSCTELFYYSEEKHRIAVRNVNLFVVAVDGNLCLSLLLRVPCSSLEYNSSFLLGISHFHV